MVHRSGSTLIIATNDADRKQIYGSNEPQILTDSQNLPQFLDGLDTCKGSEEIQKSALPSNTEPSVVSTPRTPRSFAQSKQTRKTLTALKKGRDRSSNNETPEEVKDDTNRISSPIRIRSGLRSNSLEGNIFLRPNEDAIISGLVTPRRRGRKMRKKRKDLGELKKCKSAETIFDTCQSDDQLPMKLTCSLPLDRLSGFLESILCSTRSHLSDSRFTVITDSPENSSNADNVDPDSLGHSSHLIKSLCLYCDKKFSSLKVLTKHTERVHAIVKGRRLSSRNSMSSNLSFPGCSYCCYNSNKLKTISVSEDLKSLFHHLVDFHSDRYFACKICAIRFSNSEDLECHLGEKHKAGSPNKVKSLSNKKGKGKNSPFDNNFVVDSTKSTQPFQVDTTYSDKASSLGDDTSNDPESTPTKTRRQLKQAMENKPLTTRLCQNVLRSDETILSRLGVAQNRLPRGRKGVRNRRICALDSSKNELTSNAVKTRSKVGRVVTSNVMEPLEPVPRPPNSRIEVLSCTFDEDFYESVSINVRKNLSCHLDGKLEGSPTSPSPLCPIATFPTIRSTVVKSPLDMDSEIHEATALSTLTAFPTLLTAEQYGSDLGGAAKIKRPITKHSWKWKWDCVKKYKYVNEGGKIVKKIKQPIAGFRDLSKLDMWTQLTMRTKHEVVRRQYNKLCGLNEVLGIGETVREEKRKQIAQLNNILDTRRLPQIILEQSEQTIIKMEIPEESNLTAPSPTSAISPQHQLLLDNIFSDLRDGNFDDESFPKMLNLSRRDPQTTGSQEDLILSGEWARPRCYICFGCGAKFDKLKSLEEHKMFRHPYVYSTHYEIVGRELIEGDLYKHFYLPTKALNRHKEYKQRMAKRIDGDGKIGFNENSTCGEESMDSVNSVPASYTTGTSRSDCDTESKIVSTSTSSSVTASLEIEEESVLKFHGHCTKCRRECGGLLELYRHMLDCSGDYAWILAKKRKYRYFGAKKRRHARHNLPIPRRKINKDPNVKAENSDGSTTQKPKSYPTTPRPKPSDAESIRRMLENLPAKRACRQIIPNITKPRVRKIPQGILVKGKNGKKSKGNVANTTVTAITKRILRNHNKRIYTRHLRQVRNSSRKKMSTKKATKSKKEMAGVPGNIMIVEKEKLEEEICPKEEEKKCIVISEESLEARGKNVVQALGKKTRRFVKKISQKLQANKKAFLNKKITRSNANDTTENNTTSKQNDESISVVTEKNNEQLGTECEETESKNATKTKNKKLLKGSSSTLLRKLSFRNSSKNKISKKITPKDNSLVSDEKDSTAKETNTDIVNSSGQTSLDNKTIDITSTNLLPAQDGKKIVKTKTFKKILSKFKEKGNKKVSNSEETENNLDTAATANVTNNDVRNIEKEVFTNDAGKPAKIDDKNIVIERTGNEVEPKDKGEELPSNTSILDVDVQPLNLSLPLQPVLQISPSTKRRGKKLNDCIAMLTGKLQEKLGKPFFESSENLDSALSRQSSTTDVSAPQDLSNTSGSFSTEIPSTLITKCANKPTPDECFDKKPPKRKTVTRKIIKKDNGASDTINLETNLGNDNALSSILRPPILKVSRPKDALNSDYSVGLDKNSASFQEKTSTEAVSTSKCNELEASVVQVVQNKAEPDGSAVQSNEKNKDTEEIVISCNTNSTFAILDQPENIINTQMSNVSSDISSNINLSSLNKNKNLEINKVIPGSAKGRKKIVRKGGKKKTSSTPLAIESTSISNMTSDGLNISEEITTFDNLFSSKPLIEPQLLAVNKETTIDLEKNCGPDKNIPKKRPGRKPKQSFSKIENNQHLTDNFGHSNSTPCNSEIRDIKKKDQENIQLDQTDDEVKITNVNCASEKQLAPFENVKSETENKNSSASIDVCLKSKSTANNLVANEDKSTNSTSKLKAESPGKNIGKRKGRPGSFRKNSKKVCKSPGNSSSEFYQEEISCKPSDTITSDENKQDRLLQENIRFTKSVKGKQKKGTNKKTNKDIKAGENSIELAQVDATEVTKQAGNIPIKGFQEIPQTTPPTLKKKGGRKKKNMELIHSEVACKIPATTDITEKTDEINTPEEKLNVDQTPKVETKKYTRKTTKKIEPKPSTSFDPFDAIKFCLDNTSVNDIINLNEENQVPTTTSECITLCNTLSLSPPPRLLPPLESGVTQEKTMKNRRGRRPGNFKGGKRKQQNNDNKSLLSSTSNVIQEGDERNRIWKQTNFTNTDSTDTSITKPPCAMSLMNIEGKCEVEKNSFAVNECQNIQCERQNDEKNYKVGNALTEVEEIVASFLSDDDDAQNQTDNFENSADRPIRLDGAEAILAEHDDLNEENTLSSNTEQTTHKAMQNDENGSICKVKENTTQILPAINPPNLEQKHFALANEKFRVICREVSVSLVKLPEETVNFIKEGNATKEDILQKNKVKKVTTLKQKGEGIFKTEKEKPIASKSRYRKNKTVKDEFEITQLSQNDAEEKSRKTTGDDINFRDNCGTASKNEDNSIKVIQKSENSNEKNKNHLNIGTIDEASISSNFKSQDGSETDTRPDSAAKKQRKRRKNELAAIVADQLLESFKEVDKSKIDDLKMLENLAYEKSEDLLLTGMRLTPTTKRKIVVASENKDSTNSSMAANKDNKIIKRKPGEILKIKSRSRSQPNHKSSAEVADIVNTTMIERSDKEDQPNASLTKKRKIEKVISNSHENLFRSLSKNDEPLKLNVEPLPYKHNFRICSNFNTTQFEVFSTFKSSFDTFRSLTDLSFMNRKDILRKSNFVPGSTETSNSVDSQSLRQDDATKASDTNAGDKNKLSFTKKLKKKFGRKKEKKAESENINELRTGLELFSFEKDTNNDTLVSKSFNKIVNKFSLTGKNQKETKFPIIAKSQLSFSSPDLINRGNKANDLQLGSECRKPLLRPSILTATLEAPRSSVSDALTNEVGKPLSSRDPRLNKNKVQSQCEDQEPQPSSFERHKMGSIRQRRKSERDVSILKDQVISESDDLNTAFLHPRERLRSSRKEKTTKRSDEDNVKNPSEIGRSEEDEDNYLSQIAKSVNDKIMSSEDEGDGFEMCNENSTLLLVDRAVRPSTSMSLRSMPNFNDDQSNAEFLHEDDNTNTELIDMDLEDDMSVYTSFSQDVSRFASKGKFGSKRRRRKSILLTRKPKKQNITSDQPEEVFNCDICNKSFRKAAALSKHQMTLTHIAKLSEHEYLHASKTQPPQKEDQQEEPSMNSVEEIENDNCDNPTEYSHPTQSILELEMEEKELEPVEELVNEGEAAAAMPVETEVPIEPVENIVEKPPPITAVVNLLNQPGIEPISSPEQVETNYERYQSVSSRIALSQEERLFYECCNMLKGSETPMVERTYPIVPYSTYDVPNKPVTPKSSERFSYLGSEVTGNFHHGTAYTVKSPMSQSRTSPRHAYPKIDVNQFSDISSDSNPAFPRAQLHPNLQSNLNYPNADLTNKTFSPYPHHSPVPEVQNAQTGICRFEQAVPPHNYHGSYFSGVNGLTPTQFPTATDGAAASLTARTFFNENVKDYNSGRETVNLSTYGSDITHERNQAVPHQDQNFTSPIHSTSSQGSTTTTCRMKTKAAMKGYDNFKVSIPTVGLDMQQALERSPHGGCKLTALAEIALGSEAPIATRYPPMQISEEICDKAKVKPDINEKFAKKYQELIKSNMKPVVPKAVKKKETPEKTGNKLGFKAKKNKNRGAKNVEVSKSPDKQKDIYEFDDSEEMEPSEMKSHMRGRSNKSNEEKIVIPERPFKDIGLVEQQGIKFHKPDELNHQNEESLMSSTSYSDRDDFNYGSMSDNEEVNQDEEGSSDSESNSSARTAKTIENKCLIMGRIFKNATKNRPEDKKAEKNSSEQKKKLPTQELNKLFDSLREVSKETDASELLQTPLVEAVNTTALNTNSPKEAANLTNILEKPNDNLDLDSIKSSFPKKGNPKSNEQPKQVAKTKVKQTEINATDLKEKESKSELETKESKERKEIRRRSRKDASQQQSKEIYKLQSELGMSAEEIANLISEGKRKSQRRCAANRPQKFVETWSSDEYEDFLSTKDIIAFIEEKEKKSRKRKSNSRNNEKKKISDFSIVKPESNSMTNTQSKPDKETVGKGTSNSKVNLEDNSNKKPEKIVDKLLEKINKAQKGFSNAVANREENVKLSDESFTKSDKEKKSAPIKTSDTNSLKKPTLSAKPRLKNKTADSESDFETEWRLSRTKIKKRRKTISFKEQESSKKLSKPADASRKLPSKSKTNNSSKGNPNAKSAASAEGVRPQARRKRVASEMLYYWSSSSDEEFGRIETRDDDDDDISPEGEHYQQHGWIVGDSHKKLVTLLAIAKGKKVEDCVVKETGHKKKS